MSEPDVEEVAGAALTASRVLVAIAARSLASAEDTVTLPQFRLLVLVSSRGPLKLAAIAQQLTVNSSTALRMIERLEAAGMADRAVNPDNRREILVSLTDAGHAVVDEVTARRREELASIVARMKPKERKQLVRALEAFAEAAGEPAADESSRLGWP